MNTFLNTLLVSCLFSSFCLAQVTIHGFVIDTDNAKGIKGATVFLHDGQNIAFDPPINVETDQNGYFEIADLPYGSYSVNSYVYFTDEGTTYAFVYQPGTVTATESKARILYEGKLQFDFGFSFNYMLNHHRVLQMSDQSSSIITGRIPVYGELPFDVAKFLTPRVITNDILFTSSPSSFILEKTWE